MSAENDRKSLHVEGNWQSILTSVVKSIRRILQ